MPQSLSFLSGLETDIVREYVSYLQQLVMMINIRFSCPSKSFDKRRKTRFHLRLISWRSGTQLLFAKMFRFRCIWLSMYAKCYGYHIWFFSPAKTWVGCWNGTCGGRNQTTSRFSHSLWQDRFINHLSGGVWCHKKTVFARCFRFSPEWKIHFFGEKLWSWEQSCQQQCVANKASVLGNTRFITTWKWNSGGCCKIELPRKSETERKLTGTISKDRGRWMGTIYSHGSAITPWRRPWSTEHLVRWWTRSPVREALQAPRTPTLPTELLSRREACLLPYELRSLLPGGISRKGISPANRVFGVWLVFKW